MKGAPIPLVLDLWALGHSQGQIAAMVGFPNRRHVERIISHARTIGDPRAVRHATGDRVLGKRITDRVPRAKKRIDGFVVVPALGKPLCLRGHARTPENLRGDRCRICENALAGLRREIARRA